MERNQQQRNSCRIWPQLLLLSVSLSPKSLTSYAESASLNSEPMTDTLLVYKKGNRAFALSPSRTTELQLQTDVRKLMNVLAGNSLMRFDHTLSHDVSFDGIYIYYL
ncbi:hypothetical protein SAY86_000316 [Trapa natans]|uniref:Uncharacterized protein n=1 Tax=Trapa natans TaxID=22666 RepID=A0AAN7RMS4_TRANT|nr:hypothetical protein SAY86_000316 [Trapa natans]